MNKQERVRLYMDYLVEEGFRPTVDSDGDVTFKAEGGLYCIDIDENDDEYFRILYPNFWKVESEQERTRVISASNYATMVTKVAKVYLRSDDKDTCAAVEMFVNPPENFKPVFARAMRALRSSVKTFVEKMGETGG